MKGLQKRFRDSNVPALCLLYVDCDCSSKATSQMFRSGWPDITIRQDICHFMRRITADMNTESHQLCSVFMGRLSRAIFAWDRGDFELLKEAEMQAKAIQQPTDSAILKRLGHREMSLHCRWITGEWKKPLGLLNAPLQPSLVTWAGIHEGIFLCWRDHNPYSPLTPKKSDL